MPALRPRLSATDARNGAKTPAAAREGDSNRERRQIYSQTPGEDGQEGVHHPYGGIEHRPDDNERADLRRQAFQRWLLASGTDFKDVKDARYLPGCQHGEGEKQGKEELDAPRLGRQNGRWRVHDLLGRAQSQQQEQEVERIPQRGPAGFSNKVRPTCKISPPMAKITPKRQRGSARNRPFQLACMAHNESGR